MNLVIFTPAIKSSAIGRMAALVTNTLAIQGHKVTVARTESENLLGCETHDFGAPVLPWNYSARLSDIVRRAHMFVYQIGDNYEFHKGGLHWLPRFPGVVCLHDFYLGNLFHKWAQSSRAEADAVLRTWYGNDVVNRFFRFSNSEAFIEVTREASPMTEWMCSMALGVITHGGWGCERVLNSCPGPVRVVPPYSWQMERRPARCMNFTAANYARELIDTVKETLRARPALKAIGYFCDAMHQWSARTELLTIEEIINPLRIFENCVSPALDS